MTEQTESTNTMKRGAPLAKTPQKQTNEVKGVEFKQFSLEGKRSLLLPAVNPL